MPRRRAIWLAALLGLLVGAWLLFNLPGRHPGAARSRVPHHLSLPQWEEQLVRRGLRELAEVRANKLRPLTISQRVKSMPPAMRQAVRETIGPAKRLHLAFDRAQYATSPIGIGLWLVQGEGVTCVFRDHKATSTCDTSADARRRGLELEVYKPSASARMPPTHFIALGVVPSRVKGVLIKIGHRSSMIRTRNNTFAVRAETPIEVERLVP